jgi:putative Mg2+ transporter-C (MgtC) family protein
MSGLDFGLRLGVALAAGLLIGVERQWRQRMAGLRTNTLVSLGAGLFCLIAAMTDHESSPTRIAAQIASGIGFLGAGVIMRDGLTIRGLNTAATLWCAAAAGAMAGSGFPVPALIGSAGVLVTNLVLRRVANKFEAYHSTGVYDHVHYEIRVTSTSAVASHIRELLLTAVRDGSLILEGVRLGGVPGTSQFETLTTLAASEPCDLQVEQLVAWLALEAGVISIDWKCLTPNGNKNNSANALKTMAA